jgi:hypothetical protein
MPPKETSLKISGKKQSQLSKNQVRFNQLAAKIEKLEKELIDSEIRLNQILEYYSKLVIPAQKETAKQRFELVKAIDQKVAPYKLGKVQTQKVQELILDQFDDACQHIQPEEDTQEVFNRWSDISFQDELQRQQDEMKDMVEDYLFSQMGMDIDLSEFDDSPEGQAKLFERMKAEWEKQQEYEEPRQNKAKTKKQSAKEEKEKLQEEIKTKSLRSIYYSLAKMLHPDLEQDIDLKVKKEDALKKVTVAFENKDLSTLLKLEMEWIHKESEHLEQLSEDKLKIYIDVLKQQEKELKEELDLLYMNPRFQEISSFADYKTNEAQVIFEETVRTLTKQQKSIVKTIKDIENYPDKKTFMQFVDRYFKQITQMPNIDMLNKLFGSLKY